MQRNPQRLAWTVTLTALAVFLALAISIPLSIRFVLHNATRSQQARITCLEGTAVLEDPRNGTALPLLKGESLSVPEGTVVSVDETAEAVVTFFDQSSVRLFPQTSVVLEQMRTPRFSLSPRPANVSITAKGGRLWANTVLRGSWPVEFLVKSIHAHTHLAEDGGYTFEISNQQTEVIVQRGAAQVAMATAMDADSSTVTVSSRQRTIVPIGQPPLTPLKAERDLVTNGDFSAPLDNGWLAFNEQGGDGGEVDGTVSLIVDEGRRAVRFFRSGGEYNHCETIIEQEINRDLPEPLTTIKVRSNVKVINQSLSGGGYLSSEYPLMIRVLYRDVYGNENEWIHGFYFQNRDNNPTMNSQPIEQGKWYFYESENLLEVLPVQPRRIVRLRVYASGWSYESMVSDISLAVE